MTWYVQFIQNKVKAMTEVKNMAMGMNKRLVQTGEVTREVEGGQRARVGGGNTRKQSIQREKFSLNNSSSCVVKTTEAQHRVDTILTLIK